MLLKRRRTFFLARSPDAPNTRVVLRQESEIDGEELTNEDGVILYGISLDNHRGDRARAMTCSGHISLNGERAGCVGSLSGCKQHSSVSVSECERGQNMRK